MFSSFSWTELVGQTSQGRVDESAPVLPVAVSQKKELEQGSFKDVSSQIVLKRRCVIGLLIGALTGLVAAAYYEMFEQAIVWYWGRGWYYFFAKYPTFSQPAAVVSSCWILGTLAGLAMTVAGQPTANLPGLIGHFYEGGGRVTCSVFRTLRVAVVSTIGIAGGGSLGPEAPIVSMGAGVANAVLSKVGHDDDGTVATLCGMASGFAGFFGDPIGGAIFALEVVHRNGLEFYEAVLPCVLAGAASCVMCRLALGRPNLSSQIWETDASDDKDMSACLALGVFAGLVGGFFGWLWIKAISVVKPIASKLHILPLTSLGGLLIGAIGVASPGTLFWGEHEIDCLFNPDKDLPHNPYGRQGNGPANLFATGILKLAAILVTVSAGYRGGFIFPFMHSGIAIGASIAQFCHFDQYLAIFALATGAALNVAPTRTPVATSLIMTTLANRLDAILPVFLASMVSMVLSERVAVIQGAKSREDL